MTTNTADFMGSLSYNLNSALGFTLGDPTQTEIVLYSDLVWTPNSDHTFRIAVDYWSRVEREIEKEDWSALEGDAGYTTGVDLTKDDWQDGDWFLGGLKWLPWFAPPPHRSKKDTYVIRFNDLHQIMYNPLSMPVLQPTMMSMAKLAGIGLGTYFTLVMSYKLLVKVI